MLLNYFRITHKFKLLQIYLYKQVFVQAGICHRNSKYYKFLRMAVSSMYVTNEYPLDSINYVGTPRNLLPRYIVCLPQLTANEALVGSSKDLTPENYSVVSNIHAIL